MHIDHVTLRTNYLKETRDFLLQVFDLKEGERPARIANGINGHWLYHKDAPLIHLIQSYADNRIAAHQAAESIDHCGFFMENYSAFKSKQSAVPLFLS